jgi:PIN domain nuclease of toxin-antitoxin system
MGFETVRAVLDTRAVLWAVLDDPRLGNGARAWMEKENPATLAISDMTLLEISMLAAKGRIEVEDGIEGILNEIQVRLQVLKMDARIAAEAMRLELPQSDPFDRVIVATARQQGVPVLTRDRAITKSGLVSVIW